jgi:photosystem II stability/assembly factor-like uncharacterized protein
MSDNDTFPTNQDFVYALAATPGKGGKKLCFAAHQSGLYVSEDSGTTWQPAYASLNLDAPLSTTCLALSPDFETKADLYAGVPGFVMHSADGGKDWSANPLPLDSCVPTALAISPDFAADGTLFAGTNEDGVLRSTDRGRTWFSWNFGLIDFNVLCLAVSPAFAADETVFCGTSSGLFISQNGGRSWNELPLPAGYVPVLSVAVSPSFAQDGTLLAGTEADGLYASHDRGQTWQRLCESQIGGVLNQVIVSSGFSPQGEVLATHENSLLRSTDGGVIWTVLLEGDITALAALWDETGEPTIWVGLVDGTIKRI